jgi:hypothetical protein
MKQIDIDARWSEITAAAKDVAEAYKNLLKASDNLAELMCYPEHLVLLNVLPKNAENRRVWTRIPAWVESEKKGVLPALRRENDNLKKKELLARLELTRAEMSLLGIKIEA